MVLKKIEETLGLPPLQDISEMRQVLTLATELMKLVNGLDMGKTQAVKEILEVASRLPPGREELGLVVELVRELKEIPTERIKEVDRLIKRVESLVKATPDDLVNLVRSAMKEE